jgi:hypothetical protein
MSKIPKVELRLARMNPVMLMEPDTKEPTSGYPAGRFAMSDFKLSIKAPSFMIGLPPLIPSKSAALPTRIPPLKRFPANDPNAAAPELAKDPKPEARP